MGLNQGASVNRCYVFTSIVIFPPQLDFIVNLSECIDLPLLDRNKIAPCHRATRLHRYSLNLLISLFYICIASNTFDTVNKEPKAILKQLQSLVFIVYSVYTFSLVSTFIYTYSSWLSSRIQRSRIRRANKLSRILRCWSTAASPTVRANCANCKRNPRNYLLLDQMHHISSCRIKRFDDQARKKQRTYRSFEVIFLLFLQ